MRTISYPKVSNLKVWYHLTLLSLFCVATAGLARAAAPVIDSVKPQLGIPLVTSVKIYGANFNTRATANYVFFGATKATVTAATADSLTVTVPTGALFMPVTVGDSATGLTAIQRGKFIPVFDTSCVYLDTFRFRGGVNFHTTVNSPSIVAIGDLDGDGKSDLVSCNTPPTTASSTNYIDIFRNTATSGAISSSSFTLSSTLNPNFLPVSVKLFDLDADGRLDMILTGKNSRFVKIYRNITTAVGSIAFSLSRDYLAIQSSTTVAPDNIPLIAEAAIADFDGDGKPDIALAVSRMDSVTILRNTMPTLSSTATFPASGFSAYSGFNAGPSYRFPTSIIATDMDNDGKTDLAVSDLLGTIGVFRNTTSGTITFDTAIEYALPAATYFGLQMGYADFNGDGLQDLFVATTDSNTYNGGVSVFPNSSTSGSISLGTRFDYTLGFLKPYTAAAADLNGDGKAELLVGDAIANNITIYKNIGATGAALSGSSFSRLYAIATGHTTFGISIGDLDGDTHPDIIVSNNSDTSFTIIQNHPKVKIDSIIGRPSISLLSTTTRLSNIAIGGTWTSSNTSVASIEPTTGLVHPITFGNATITYTIICSGDTESVYKAITITTLIPVIDSVTPHWGIPASTTATIHGRNFTPSVGGNIVYFGATEATILAAYDDSIVVRVPIGAIFAPVSVTDTMSNLTAYQPSQYFPIFDNSCFITDTIRFNPKVDFRTSLHPPYMVAVGDIDGDGKPDFITANRPSSTRGEYHIDIFRNTATSGTVTTSSLTLAHTIVSLSTRPTNIKVADLDGDGRLDLVVTVNNSRFINVYRNITASGTIAFAAVTSLAGVTQSGSPHGIPSLISEVVVADFNRDGKPDLACANAQDSVGILINRIGTLSATAAFPTSSFVNRRDFSLGSGTIAPVSLITADFNNDGRMDLATSNFFSSNITVLRDTATVADSIGFAAPQNFSLPSSLINCFQLASGDLNGDNKQEIVVVGYEYTFTPSIHNLSIFPNTSTTSAINFGSSVNITSGLDRPTGVALGDFNADTKLDIAVTNSGTGSVGIFRNVNISGPLAAADFILGNSYTTGTQPVGVTVADVDGDTRVDLIVANSNDAGTDSTFSVFRNRPKTFVDSIVGMDSVCQTSTSDTMRCSSTGGSWRSSNTGIASIDPVSGRLYPITLGTVTISYTYVCGGDTATATKVVVITSVPTVGSITGGPTLCTATTTTLRSLTPGGTWGSLSPSIATIDSVTGVAQGLTTGTAVITYAVNNSCGTRRVTTSVNVRTSPGAITGASSVCVGSNVTLSATPTGGTWSSSASTIAIAYSSTGVVQGAGAGSATITYTASGGCYSTAPMTVNATPTGISGSSSICLGDSVSFSDADGGGAWSSSNSSVATIDPASGYSYTRSAGTATISYTFTSTGCYATFPITVNSLPAPIRGTTTICSGNSVTLSSTTAGGTWSSSAAGVATVSTASGSSTTLTGASFGAAIITYNIAATGCSDTALVIVNANPAPITGPTMACLGSMVTVSDASSFGVWRSSNPSMASITSTGDVYAVAGGTVTLSYTFTSTSCFVTRSFTVNNPPSAISGLSDICPGYTITASSTPSAGTFSHTSPSVATVGASTGLITGASFGTDTITYTVTATGCSTTATFNVYPAPSPIYGPDSLCAGTFIVLSDTTIGGTWSTSDASIASVDAAGFVTGTSAGLAIISYTTSIYGCSAFYPVLVNPVPVPSISINTSTGTTICNGTSVIYRAIPVNGGTAPTYKWFVRRTLVSTSDTFVYTPINGDTIALQMTSNALCANPAVVNTSVIMTVNPTVFPSVTMSTGIGDTVCLGSPVTFTPTPVLGGTAPVYNWRVNGVRVWTGPTWTYVPANGDRVTVILNTNVTCRNSDTVSSTKLITVSAYVPAMVSISGSDTACASGRIVYTAIGVNSGFNPTYTWQVNGFDYTNGPVLSYPAATGDIISVKLVSSFPCLSDTTATATKGPLTVIAATYPHVFVSANPGFIVRAGMYVTMYAHVTDSGSHPTYRWFKNAIPIAGANKWYYTTNNVSNWDSFVCRVTNYDICNGITGFGYIIMNIGDNIGVHDIANDNITLGIAPNPNSGSFTLNGDFGTETDEEMTIEISSTLGQVIYASKVLTKDGALSEQILLDEKVAAGMYFLSVKSAHTQKTIRFIVN